MSTMLNGQRSMKRPPRWNVRSPSRRGHPLQGLTGGNAFVKCAGSGFRPSSIAPRGVYPTDPGVAWITSIRFQRHGRRLLVSFRRKAPAQNMVVAWLIFCFLKPGFVFIAGGTAVWLLRGLRFCCGRHVSSRTIAFREESDPPAAGPGRSTIGPRCHRRTGLRYTGRE